MPTPPPPAAAPISRRRQGAVGIVSIDAPPVNALSRPVRQGLIAALRALDEDTTIQAVVLTGAPGRFIAGADLQEIAEPLGEPFLPDLVAAIEALRKPVVAAIDGAALGGGLEIALACDLRLGTPAATLGLPETRLGLIPGAGGTQRLPRLVGIAVAIDLIGQARTLAAAEALSLGILDAIVAGDVVAAAVAAAPATPRRRVSALALPAPGRAAADAAPPAAAASEAAAAAAAAAIRQARGNPAVTAAIAVIRAAATESFAQGVARERDVFLRCRASPEAAALRHLFLAERESRKIPGLAGAAARPVARVAVIGAGTMGAGIAVCFADAGVPVDLVEQHAEAAAAGLHRVDVHYERQVRGGRLDSEAVLVRRARIAATAAWDVIGCADLVIEAAFEEMAVKTDIFRRLDRLARPGAILATNTSYLDIDAIAAVTQRPQDVLGLHFFSPAPAMRLIEVVAAARTAPEVLATGLAIAGRIGKVPVFARVCDGFIGNRIYAAYRRHAEYLLEDGASPQEIDAAVEAYGFAMGPFRVADLSGLDIAWAMRKRRAARRDPGERYVAIADRLCEAGWLGRKAGRGWYRYESGAPCANPEVDALIAQARARRAAPPQHFSAQAIQRRLLAVMANEGAKLLAEGIALRASDVDLVLVHGYGFPRLAGGPMFAADRRGLETVLDDIEEAALAGGVGSEPAPLLVDLARAGGRLGDWQGGVPAAVSTDGSGRPTSAPTQGKQGMGR